MSSQPQPYLRGESVGLHVKTSVAVCGPVGCDRAAFDALVAKTRAEHPDAELCNETRYDDGRLETFVTVFHKPTPLAQPPVMRQPSDFSPVWESPPIDESHSAWAERTAKWVHDLGPSIECMQYAITMLHSVRTSNSESRRQFQLSLDALMVSADAFKRAQACAQL
ncbi:MAG: hypothetical protein Q7V62_03720 [Actinomycetota bacterium]|nr:hypothetical protein [Actinomycetota bacterium]